MLELLLLLLLQLGAVGDEAVEQVVNDVRLEDSHTDRVGHLLRVSFDLHIERQNNGVPVGTIQRKRINSFNHVPSGTEAALTERRVPA